MTLRSPFAILGCLTVLAACTAQGAMGQPLPRAGDRPTPLHFGLYVTPDPEQNPIDPPERFTGYHTATDFEILPGEDDDDVPVYAICDGEIVSSGSSEGYGGLAIQHCTIKGEPVTVLYGHLAVASLTAERTDARVGQQIGILGAGRSVDTDGNRKHLHLGVVKGHGSTVLGYVQTPQELSQFIDPQTILPR